jgi:hypothetical protein
VKEDLEGLEQPWQGSEWREIVMALLIEEVGR